MTRVLQVRGTATTFDICGNVFLEQAERPFRGSCASGQALDFFLQPDARRACTLREQGESGTQMLSHKWPVNDLRKLSVLRML